MDQLDASTILSLKTRGFSQAVKERLLAMPHGLENMEAFAVSAQAGDSDPMSMPVPGGEMVMEWEDGAIHFSLEFLSKDILVAELDQDQIVFHGHSIPEAVCTRQAGKQLMDLIDLPTEMSDLGKLTAISLETTQNGFQAMLDNPSSILTKEDLLASCASNSHA